MTTNPFFDYYKQAWINHQTNYGQQSDQIMGNLIYQGSDQGLSDGQLQSEIDSLDKQLEGLNPDSIEYNAATQIKSALASVLLAKSYQVEALQPPHPDSEFFKSIHAATEKHGQGDYGITDLKIGEDYTLRSSYQGGRIFHKGETIVQFKSPYAENGRVGHPIKVTGQVSPEQKEFILNQVNEIEKEAEHFANLSFDEAGLGNYHNSDEHPYSLRQTSE